MGGAERGRVLGEPRRRKHAKRAQRVAGAENAGAFWLSEQVTTKLNTASQGGRSPLVGCDAPESARVSARVDTMHVRAPATALLRRGFRTTDVEAESQG